MRTISPDQDDVHRYDDMLKMTRHISKNHPSMPIIERAAQFKPFAALTGYEESLREAEKASDSGQSA